MSTTPRELHKDLVNPGFAAPVELVVVNLTNSSTSTATVYGMSATRKLRLYKASYIQSAAAAGTSFTCQLKVGSTVLTNAMAITSLSANTNKDFTVVEGVDIADGSVISAVFTASSGTTAPGTVALTLEFLLME